jgi:branched-chain amino acid aminotransferase
MKEVGKIWMNGKLVPFKDAKVHVLTHALHYSTSIFEGIRCYDTPNGSAIFRLEDSKSHTLDPWHIMVMEQWD